MERPFDFRTKTDEKMKSHNYQAGLFAWIFLVLLFAVGHTARLFAQTESNEEKQRARISLDFFSINNEEQKLVATVKVRVEGFFQNVSDAEIDFYKEEVSPEHLMGSVKTDANGRAEISFSQGADTTLWFTYFAVLEDDPNFVDAENDIEVRRGFLKMDTEEMDSVKMIEIFVGAPDSAGNIAPVEEVGARIFVERLFGLLPVSDEFGSTDEEGVLSVEFPADIPGDENGNITLVAQVSDHEEFGNLVFKKRVSWGVPNKMNESELVKELWLSSSNTSGVFLIIVNLMLMGVFGVVVYIVIQLFKISRLGLEGNPK